MVDYINPNNPVYFTYARNSNEKAEWKHIADVVPDLLQIFRKEKIKYSVDIEDIRNGAKISSYEKEIGNANYVIVILSDRYFYRHHCMFELFNVLKNTEGKTIKFIKVGQFNIDNNEYRAKLKEFWHGEKAKIDNKIATYRNPNLSELEHAAINNNYYLDFIDQLSSLFQSVSYTSADVLRDKLFIPNILQKKFIFEIKKDFGWMVPLEVQKTSLNKKYLLYSSIVVLFCLIVWLIVEQIEKYDGNDNIDNNTQKERNIIITSDNHGYVDLGLPSKTLWATCNVGAENAWDSGDYFAWGEISSKSKYDWSNYKYCDGGFDELTKYCHISNYGKNGFTDNIILLEKSDDVATIKWGEDWCLPTIEEWHELNTICQWEWIDEYQNGRSGYLISNNNNEIFLPASGWRYDDKLAYMNIGGYYWSSSLYLGHPSHARNIFFDAAGVGIDYFDGIYRCDGFPIRPVRAKK